MDVLKGFLRRRRMNALFPFSCLALVALLLWLFTLPAGFARSMAVTLAAIGLLEHILLMLPVPVERLWHWSLAGRKPAPTPHQHDHTQHKMPPPKAAMGVLS
jgi:membrane-bound metal-dependent hydrolase YbcI (DUF457 family)